MTARVVLTFVMENSWGEAVPDNSMWTAVESVIKDKIVNVLGADHVEILAVGPANLDVSFQLNVGDAHEHPHQDSPPSLDTFSNPYDEDDEDDF